MQYVGKLVTTMSEFYRDLNPSTLTGAMDVLVVEDEVSGERRCTPFHVRIGKLQLMRPQDKRVEVSVNGKVQGWLEMKVGEAGEAFFIVPRPEVNGEGNDDDTSSTGGRTLSGDESDMSTSPLPPAALSPEHPKRSEFTLSPTKPGSSGSQSNPPILHQPSSSTADARATFGSEVGSGSGALSDSEIDYARPSLPSLARHDTIAYALKHGKWLDVLEWVSDASRVIRSIREIGGHCGSIKLGDTLDVLFYRCQEPLPVHRESDYPQVIDQMVESERLVPIGYSEFISDPLGLASEPLLSRVVARVGQVWWFGGREAVLLGLGIRLFGRLPEEDELQDIFPRPTPLIVSAPPLPVLDKERDQPSSASKAVSGWRHWWYRSNPPNQAQQGTDTQAQPATSADVQTPTSTSTQTPSQGTPTGGQVTTITTQPVAPATNARQAAAGRKFIKTLRLTSEQLQNLPLEHGSNTITFSFATGRSCAARVFLWPRRSRIVISDIDGTITRSDALGHILTLVGRDWTHSGVAGLYDRIKRNGYKLMYLSARAIGQAGSTREYLKGVEQDQCRLPDGPVIMSPDRLLAALRREVLIGNPEEFKIACLKDIQLLFQSSLPGDTEGLTMESPFYSGFGNRFTDAQSYHAVGIPPHRIFTVDPTGEVRVEHGLGYTSTYKRLYDLVDMFFPPLQPEIAGTAEATTVEEELPQGQEDYNEYNYWRRPTDISDDLQALLPAPSSTAILAGDAVLIIEPPDVSVTGATSQTAMTSTTATSESDSESSSYAGDRTGDQKADYPFL